MPQNLRLDIVVHTSPVDQALLASITAQLTRLITNQEVLMEDVKSLNEKLDNLTTTVTAERAEVQTMFNDLRTQVQALKDQIAQGALVTQADLDALGAKIDAADAGIKAISEA